IISAKKECTSMVTHPADVPPDIELKKLQAQRLRLERQLRRHIRPSLRAAHKQCLQKIRNHFSFLCRQRFEEKIQLEKDPTLKQAFAMCRNTGKKTAQKQPFNSFIL